MTDPSIRLRNAIKEDNYFITSRLLKRFPFLLDNIDPSNGWSNLHYSAFHNNYQISELLLKYIHSRFISTSLKLSTQDNSIKLKDKNSSLYNQITDEDEIKLTFEKQTVLHVACLGNSAATLNLLLSYFNVCIDQRDIKGFTPSHICCIKGFSDCLSILLEKGSYPNIQDNNGDTPLHKAFQYSNSKCLELLIRYKADDQLLNNVGWKPIDVAFDNDIIQEYKLITNLNSNNSTYSSNIIQNDSNLISKLPQTKYAPTKVNQNNVRTISFLPSTHNSSSSSSNYPTRINLPSIQPRKYSLSSMLSDEYVDKFDLHEDTRSSNSSKNSRTSSPSCSVNDFNHLPRKSPSIQESNYQFNSKRYPQPPSFSSNANPSSTLTSPRRSTMSNHSIHDSPTSKRSSLSTRTFRSNSQISETSPIKSDHQQLIQQTTGSSLIMKSGNSTPRHSLQNGYRANSSYPIPSHIEEASLKLHDLKLKNVDRLKLDTKLGNIINYTSQENLVSSPTSLNHSIVGSPALGSESNDTYNKNNNNNNDSNDINVNNNNNTNNNTNSKNLSLDLTKRSKILSIPILSSRIRHNS